MLANFPALKREEVALAVIGTVLPALAVAIDEAAQDVAADLFGDEVTVFDIERIANDVLFALGDYLSLAPIPRRGVTDLLRIHQLNNTAYAEDYFGVRVEDDAPVEYALPETEQALADSDLSTIVDTQAPYTPAITSAEPETNVYNVNIRLSETDRPQQPRVVVDNRPGGRTLEQIRAEVNGKLGQRPTTPIHYLHVDPSAEERKTRLRREKLAQKARIEANVSEYIAALDKRKEAKLEGLDVCDYVNCQGLYKRTSKHQRYCSDQCRSAACRKRKTDAARERKQAGAGKRKLL